jgi:A/G-specific adenine glycosylase
LYSNKNAVELIRILVKTLTALWIKAMFFSMKKINRKLISNHLIAWYLVNQRQLPWRETNDPYQIWVSEVMLQQTKVKTVIPFYIKFLKTFPTIKELARADLNKVLKAWEGMGYYARARNLHTSAKIIIKEYKGIIPGEKKNFLKLPGVGEYIASAVLSIAFGHAHAVVDGNVKRVLARIFRIDSPINQSKSHIVFKQEATRLMGNADSANFNQAIMELGALICSPKKPNCKPCPIHQNCFAFLHHMTDQFPKRIKSKPVPTFKIAVGVVRHNHKMLITRRNPKGLLGGLWEFPGGKLNIGESAQAACIREIYEETRLKIEVDSFITQVKHAYTHFKIVMDIFYCRYISGDVQLNGPVDFRWIKLADIHRFAFPKANLKFIPLLED